jgi:hypothetical protein
MEDRVAEVLALAFHRVPASEANEAMARLRESEGDEAQPALSYEVVLPREGGAEHLADKVLPRLVYFLHCRGARLPQCPGVFVSIFSGDELYFLRASDLVQALSRQTGLAPEEMVRRYGDGA